MELPTLLPNDPGCTKCELHEGAKSVCIPTTFYADSLHGAIDTNNLILFIGQNPGFNEDQKNEPFIGKSGDVIKKAYIGGCGLDKQAAIYLTNGVRCHTLSNETPKPRHYRECMPYTILDFHSLFKNWYQQEDKGKFIIVSLGAPATSALYKELLGFNRMSLAESFNHNGNTHVCDEHEFFVFSTYHPAAVMRNHNLINAVESHMQLVSDCLEGTMAEPSDPIIVPTRSPRR